MICWRRPDLYLALVNVPGTFVVVLLALGGLMLASGVRSEVMLWRLHNRGVEVQGEVKALWIHTRSCGKDGHSTCKTYEVEVAYRDTRGEAQQKRIEIGAAMRAGLRKGDAVAVHLLTSDPGMVVVDKDHLRGEGREAEVVALLMLLGGGGMAWHQVRKARRMVWVRDNGVVGEAKVVRHEKSGEKINGFALYRAVWQEEDGRQGSTASNWRFSLPAEGETIRISRDPGGTRGAVWHGDTGSPKA